MPYGPVVDLVATRTELSFNPSYGLHALRAERLQRLQKRRWGFNPSYGLHALRAASPHTMRRHNGRVSIPHMGCMPYGQGGGAPT